MKILNQNIITIVISVLFFNNLSAQDWQKIVNLNGPWKFTIGDDSAWAKNIYNDSNWEEIEVPSSWEDEGYHGYNGYAWYRKSFSLSKKYAKNSLYISLGYIDDVDEVYLNGELIGATGSFPPKFRTAYNSNRKYPVASELFYTNRKNILAVRVYDSELNGGIVSGDISIQMLETINMEINLEGLWKFHTGDSLEWKSPELNDKNWARITVPSKWELQGYNNYDGFAWYRKTFVPDKSLVGDKLVLMLGKIDDIDECYINGRLVANTGDMVLTPKLNNFNNEWLATRGYYIPKDFLKLGEVNTIAVRVYDGVNDGGIYEGPVGIVKQEEYIEYWKTKKNKGREKGFWDYFWDNFN